MKHVLIAVILLMSPALAIAQGANGIVSADAARATAAAKDTGTNSSSTAITHAATPAAASIPALPEPTADGEPHTEMLDTANSPAGDPLLEPKPLPRADLSLIGGIARKVDTVHNRLLVEPFGGGSKYLIYFDERTRILSGGRETTASAIHPGDRVYADTQGLGAQVFARTLQVLTAGGPAQASGQVIEVLGGQVRLQDRLSGQTIHFAISDRTKVETHSGPASAGELHSGSLIEVTFIRAEDESEAQSITIQASPGESYAFEGILTHVDLSDGVLALDNQTDGNNYELYFDPQGEKSVGKLVVGTPVSVTASFDGKRYRATSIRLTEAARDR